MNPVTLDSQACPVKRVLKGCPAFRDFMESKESQEHPGSPDKKACLASRDKKVVQH